MTVRRFERVHHGREQFYELELRERHVVHRHNVLGDRVDVSTWPQKGKRFKRAEEMTSYVAEWTAELLAGGKGFFEGWREVAVKESAKNTIEKAKKAGIDLMPARWREALGPDVALDATELDLYETKLPRSLEPLARFKKLRTLNLGGTGVRDLTPLAKLTELRELILGNNPDLVSLAPLARLTKRESLEIDYTGVKDVKPLAKLKKLRYLLIEGLDEAELAPSVAKLPKTCRVSSAS